MIFALHASTFPPARRKALADALLKHKVPGICPVAEYAEAGCLMSYGAAFVEFYPRGAVYVDKILRGAKPGDLPIEQPTRFELIVNGKTAKTLGVKIPQPILLRADKVIE